MRYVAFLRGINVGGHKKVPMATLRELFSSWGFQNVRTLLNSGNIAFDTGETSPEALVRRLEAGFRDAFGFESKMTVRKTSDLAALIASDPFGAMVPEEGRLLYVTFLPEPSRSSLTLPYKVKGDDFIVLKDTGAEVLSALNRKATGSVEAMAFLEKEFGRDVTTRNWNTVLKAAAL